MSKKKNKKIPQPQETEQERKRRLISSVMPQQPVDEPEEEDTTTLVIPDNASEEERKFAASLVERKKKLDLREQTIKEQWASLSVLVKQKVDEQINALGVDVPAAQEQVRTILADAEREKTKIIAEGERVAADLKAKAEIDVQDAQAALDRISKREETLNVRAEFLAKRTIQLENEEATYRENIGNEIAEKYKEQIQQIDSFNEAKDLLEKRAAYFKQRYEEANKQIEEFSKQLQDYERIKRELEMKGEDCSRLEETCRSLREEVQTLKNDLARIGTDPLTYKNQYEELEKSYRELKDRLANVPSEFQLAELRQKAEELDKLTKKYEEQQRQLIEVTTELTGLKTKASQLDDYIQYVRILTESKRQLQNELAALHEEYESENNNKFKALSNFDRHPIEPSNLPPFTGRLDHLTQYFLGFAQNEGKPLFYEESTIAAFFAWMASTKTMVLEGLSGTGKTSLPLVFSRFAGWYTPVVSVQSAWKDRNDLVGFFNDFKKEYKETEFLKDLYQAAQNPDRPALIVLDEMNLSRIEYYFADFLSALEHPDLNSRVIDLLPDQTNSEGMPKLFVNGGKLPIKPNIWFIGTANKDDSTFAITDKVYDRAGVIHFSQRVVETKRRTPADATFVSHNHLQQLFNDAINSFPNDAKSLYETIRNNLIECLSKNFEINVGNRIINQMNIFVPVYIKCRYDNSNHYMEFVREAIDEFIPHKVLRKLEGMYDATTKMGIDEMIKSIKEDKLPKTVAYLQKLKEKID